MWKKQRNRAKGHNNIIFPSLNDLVISQNTMTVTNKYHNLILNFEELNATSLNLEADFAAL